MPLAHDDAAGADRGRLTRGVRGTVPEVAHTRLKRLVNGSMAKIGDACRVGVRQHAKNGEIRLQAANCRC